MQAPGQRLLADEGSLLGRPHRSSLRPASASFAPASDAASPITAEAAASICACAAATTPLAVSGGTADAAYATPAFATLTC